RINPTTSTEVSYPPAEEGCDPYGPQVDLDVVKTHAAIDGDAVDSGEGDVVTYTVTIGNKGPDTAHGVSFVDTLPPGLAVDPDSIVAPPNWNFTITSSQLEGSTPDPLPMGAEVVITFDALVGELAQDDIGIVRDDLENLVCVDSLESDMNPDDN